MDKIQEKRREDRLPYEWPVWFGENFTQAMSQGLMVDIASGGIAFTCENNESCPHQGQRLVTRFSIPRFDADDSSGVTSITRAGTVRRLEYVSAAVCRVAIQFDEPLSLKPCELAGVQSMQWDGRSA